MRQREASDGRHAALTLKGKAGKLVDGATKNYHSSAPSIRGDTAAGQPLFSYKELLDAYKSVKKGRRKKVKPLPDYKLSIDLDDSELTLLGRFNKNADIRIAELYEDFLYNRYKITQYWAITVPKKDNIGRRPIMSPEPRDRIVFSAVLNRIKSKFYYLKSYNILGLGFDVNLDQPLKYFKKIIQSASIHKRFLKLDIASFFPSIDRVELLRKLSYLQIDAKVLELIKESFNCKLSFSHNSDKKFFLKYLDGKGIPQGCAYSPLLANFYFSEIDSWLRNRQITSFRYLDDILIFLDRPSDVDRVYNEIRSRGKKLSLKFSNEKQKVGKTSEKINFLGTEIYNGNLYIPEKAEQGLIDHVSSHRCVNEHDLIEKTRCHLTDVVNGWSNFYSVVTKKDYLRKKLTINDKLTLEYLKFPPKFIADYIDDKKLYLYKFKF